MPTNKTKPSDSLDKMLKAVLRVAQERQWQEYHTPKNIAMDLVREASEVLEHFIWESNKEILADKKRLKEIGKEMADVLHALLLLADAVKIDLPTNFWGKLEEVKRRYPPKKIRGQSGYQYKNSHS